MAKESDFQSDLIDKINEMFPGALVLKLDPRYIRGIPDLLILYKNKWATLECKKSKSASKRPLQPYYVKLMNDMSFSSFISPENEKEVLSALQRAFKVGGSTRVSKRK